MIKCTNCKSPLTEFDVEFFKNLRKTDSLKGAECYDCLINSKIQSAIHWRNHTKKYAFFYLAPFITVLITIFFIIILERLDHLIQYSTVISEFNPEVLQSLFMGLFLISNMGGAFVFIKDSGAFSDFISGPRLTGQHYETKLHYDGLNWIGKTEKVNDYDFTGCITPFIVLITFTLWSSVFYIFSFIRYHVVCPMRVKFAYARAKKSVDDATVSFYAKIAYHIHNKIYGLRLTAVKEKYSYLGEKELQDKINKIKKKPIVTRIAGRKAIVQIIQNNQITVITKQNNEVVIKNIFDNSFVYDECVNLYDLKISPSIIEQCRKIL